MPPPACGPPALISTPGTKHPLRYVFGSPSVPFEGSFSYYDFFVQIQNKQAGGPPAARFRVAPGSVLVSQCCPHPHRLQGPREVVASALGTPSVIRGLS